MLYVLNGKLISVSVVDNTFLLPVESIYTMTYPLACDDRVQLTLILVSFNIYVLTLSGGPLGAKHNQIINKNKLNIPCNITVLLYLTP